MRIRKAKIKNKFGKRKLAFIFLIVLVIASGLFGLRTVNAQTISNTGNLLTDVANNTISMIKNPVGYTANVVGMGVTSLAYWSASNISYAMAYIGAQFIGLESKLLAWLIDMSSFTKMPVVQVGWKVSRDFANLFFIAILIYLAFSTILKLKDSSSIQKTLFKVIVIAVLINFSLMICGIIIDFSQMLFKYFIFGNLPAGSKDSAHFTEIFANALRIKDFWTPTMTEAQQGAGTTLLTVFAQLVFVVVFIFVLVIVLGSLVLTLLVRNFWLWTLLILAPLAWFFGVMPLPALSKYAKDWWNKFLQWSFVAPIMAFFVFLAMTVSIHSTELQQTNVLPSQQAQEQVADQNGIFSYAFNKQSAFNPFNLMQMFLVIGFLMTGLYVGNSMGSKAAGAAQRLISRTGKGVKGYMSRKTTQGIGRVGGGVLGGLSADMSKIPLVGGLLSRPVGVAGRFLESKGDEVTKKEMAKVEKRLGGLSLSQLNDRFATLTKNEKAVAIEKAMKDGKMPENMKETAIAMAAEHSKKGDTNFNNSLLKIDPTLRSDWQPIIKQITKLEGEKKDLKDEAAIKSKEREIASLSIDLNKQVTETLKGLKSTEVAKTLATVMDNEKISEGVKDAFAKYAIDLDNNTVMNITGKITELPQKVSFVSTLLKMREDRVAEATEPLEKQKLEDRNVRLVKALSRNAGIRETDFLDKYSLATGKPKGSKTAEEIARANLEAM